VFPASAIRPGRPGLSVIQPDLLVGEYPNPGDIAWLRSEHGVTVVMSLQDDADLASKDLRLADLKRTYATCGMRFHHAPVADGDTIGFAARLDGIVDALVGLLARGERVYLHCNAGMNRAPTVAIAYLHVHRGLALDAARDFVKQRRSSAPYMRMLEAHYGARR
jgi:protein-tyrosine phosphatase